MKELIGIQLVIALAMMSFAYLLEFSTGDLLFIMGGAMFLSSYINMKLYSKISRKQRYRVLTKEEYNISIKDGTIG